MVTNSLGPKSLAELVREKMRELDRETPNYILHQRVQDFVTGSIRPPRYFEESRTRYGQDKTYTS
jgi:hypothetical protein